MIIASVIVVLLILLAAAVVFQCQNYKKAQAQKDRWH